MNSYAIFSMLCKVIEVRLVRVQQSTDLSSIISNVLHSLILQNNHTVIGSAGSLLKLRPNEAQRSLEVVIFQINNTITNESSKLMTTNH